MLKLAYTHAQKKRSSTMLSLGMSELEAAEVLIEQELFREALIHLYFSSFYISQSFVVGKIATKPSHKSIEAALHKHFGKREDFPRRYVDLHTELHALRNEFQYKATHSPSPVTMRRLLTRVGLYVAFANKHIPKLLTTDLLQSLYDDNANLIKDFSYDIYCPKSYKHHFRITVWQPKAYLEIFTTRQLSDYAKRFLKSLKVARHDEYVIGLNSKVDQYANHHLLLLDIDSLDVAVESELSKIGGVLFKTGRGFHFIGHKIIQGQKNWERILKSINQKARLGKYLDQDHIQISLMRGYSTLRVTANSIKPLAPVFYKELIAKK